MNKDGNMDFVGTTYCGDSACDQGAVFVVLGNGDGTFQTAVLYPTGTLIPSSVAVQDLNGDGFPDLAVFTQCSDNTCVTGDAGILLGNGDGTFQPIVNYSPGGQYARGLAVEDFNADGRPDLAVANECIDSTCANSAIALLLGNGDGTFQPRWLIRWERIATELRSIPSSSQRRT